MNLKFVVIAGLALLAGVTASSFFSVSDHETPKYQLSLDQLVLRDLEGNEQEFTQWQGKVLLVNFWATWCPPCVEEIPLFVELRKKYGADNFEIAGVAIDDVEKAKDFAASMKIDYPLLYGQAEGMGLMQKLGNRMGGLPYSVVFDRNGDIDSTKSGAYSREELEKIIKNLL